MEMKQNKICVYAICKNEAQFVDRWMDSMQEADYVVVLDTGSSDDTVARLRGRGAVVEIKEITPWRFDVARNESLKLIPADANILVCTDLDEVFEPGWADALRKGWNDEKHIRAWYKYAWSHDDLGTPARIFHYDKVHCRGWYWKYPVHEMLVSNIFTEEDQTNKVLNLFNEIYLHHYPDKTKSRSSYLPLLELRAQENPNDWIGLFYLSHEYSYRGFYDKSITLIERLMIEFKEKFTNTELAACCLFLGDNFHAFGQTRVAIDKYMAALDYDKTLREPYFLAAECANELGLYHIAIGLANEGLANGVRHYSWLERDNSWKEQPNDILSISHYYIGNKELSLQYAVAAHEQNPLDERIKRNLDFIKNAQ